MAPVEHVERPRVAWVDTDAGGRIHFTAAFRWAEMAEVGLRRKLGLVEGWGDYPRRRVEAEFLKVLVFEDEIEVRIRVERLGTSSITWAFEITRDDERLRPRRTSSSSTSTPTACRRRSRRRNARRSRAEG